MKPRAFVGSSKEGLSMAYAVQSNLQNDIEVTVWSQGVFELSSTAMESLTKVLPETDFGVFVFTPDDVVRMRGKKFSTVRDNVLFELGLFMGRLGRDRVFFFIPDDGKPLHLASDLLGITPGKYEVGRSDGSLQSACAPACNQIRIQMLKRGSVESRETSLPGSDEPENIEPDPQPFTWFFDFLDGKYDTAIARLRALLAANPNDDVAFHTSWLLYCEYKVDASSGIDALCEYAASNPDKPDAAAAVANILRREHYTAKAIEILLGAQALHPSHNFAVGLSEAYFEDGEPMKGVEVLEAASPAKNAEVAIALAQHFHTTGQPIRAQQVYENFWAGNQRHQELNTRYAQLASELNLHATALALWDGLAKQNPTSVDNWGFLGNACLALGLVDSALASYRKAAELAPNSSWILGNIGNLLNARDLPSEAHQYLTDAVSLDATSEYAHDRLSKVLSKKVEEKKKYNSAVSDGMRLLKHPAKVASVADGLSILGRAFAGTS